MKSYTQVKELTSVEQGESIHSHRVKAEPGCPGTGSGRWGDAIGMCGCLFPIASIFQLNHIIISVLKIKKVQFSRKSTLKELGGLDSHILLLKLTPITLDSHD